jgi:hypothetical protein
MIEELKKIAKKRVLTDIEKDFVRTKSAELSIDFVPYVACRNCYQDQAIILLKHLNDAAFEKITESQNLGLRMGTDIFWRGYRINAHTITDKFKEGMLTDGLEKYFPNG